MRAAMPGCAVCRAVAWGAAVAVVLGAAPARAQTKTTRKAANQAAAANAARQDLEDLLAHALKFNGDIRMAEAKLRDDEAELNRTRLHVLQKIIVLHHSLKAQRAVLNSAEAKYRRVEGLVRRGAMQPALLQEAEHDRARAQAHLEEVEAQLPALVGKGGDGVGQEVLRTEVQIGARRRAPASAIRGLAAKIHQALDRPVKVDYTAQPFGDILKDLEAKGQGIAFQHNLAIRDLRPLKLDLQLGEVPLGAALLALQDTLPGLRIVVRDYGILVTWEHQVPIGAVRLYDFWKNEAVDRASR